MGEEKEGKQKVILLVEDDPNDVILVKRAMKKAEVKSKIKVVKDGEQAMDYLGGGAKYENRKEYPIPDMILLDLKLPKKSGLELLEWVDNQPKIRRIPIVILTSSRENEDVNKAYDLGVNSYLLKPVSFDNLLEMMKITISYWFDYNQHPEVK